HDDKTPTPDEATDWPVRPDPFSTYRAGFEVRTYRRCRRVLMFHHFPELKAVGAECLVRSTDFVYADEQEPVAEHPTSYSCLASGQMLADLDGDGRLELVDLGGTVPGFQTRSASREWERFTAFEELPNLHWSDPSVRLVDLTGDGLPDVLIAADDTIDWYPS